MSKYYHPKMLANLIYCESELQNVKISKIHCGKSGSGFKSLINLEANRLI